MDRSKDEAMKSTTGSESGKSEMRTERAPIVSLAGLVCRMNSVWTTARFIIFKNAYIIRLNFTPLVIQYLHAGWTNLG